jgi:hypothetical protein
MRHIPFMQLALGVLLLAGTRGLAGEEPAAAPPAGDREAAALGIGLVAMGPVDPAVIERVRQWIEENTAAPARLHPAREAPAGDLSEAGHSLTDLRPGNDLYLIALAWPDAEVTAHAVYLYEEGIAVVNARILQPESGDAETYARRVEKLVLRSIGLLLGVEPAPIIQSAMYPYTTLEELDQMARAYDPPSHVHVLQQLRARGVVPVADSPYSSWLEP